MDEIDAAAIERIKNKVETQTSEYAAAEVTLALGVVAAKRARRAGCTKEDFLDGMTKAWALSVER